MIHEAKVMGASAVLLIVSILADEELSRLISLCRELGLSSLVEAHDGEEVRRAVQAGAAIIGVNNRNLRDFSVDPSNCLALRGLVDEDTLFVAESGISTRDDVRMLEDAGVDAVLIGEALMRADDKKAMLDKLRGME